MSKESIQFRILKVKVPVSHPYKAADKPVILYIFICIFFGAESFVLRVAILKFKDQDI